MTTTRSSEEPVTTDRLTRAWRAAPGLPGALGAVNHKQIGRRFVVTAMGFLLVGGVQSVLMRIQLGGPDQDVLSAEAYNQAFTMHGTTMMFLFAVPVLEGLAMYLVPLMIGARDLPFPRLNAFGYWAYLFGGIILYWSFATGSVPDGGWFAYTPLTSTEFSPGSGLDFWLLGVTFVEISGIVGAVELVIVILRHRAPGMSLNRMPLYVWSNLVMAAMILFAFPAVITASTLLEIERKVGAPFYDATRGGNELLWQHLFWIFGHPEVYIMLLPATGIVSAIVPVFARRRIVGYTYIVISQVAIAILSFGLWVHHMFTTGLPALVLAFFGVSSVLIAIPSGVQVFAWLATLRHGRPRWDTPLLYVGGFVFIFVLGGITGVMVAAFPFDAQVHDSYFVVAHFHYVLIGGMVFPVFGGLHHWFPKMVGRQPSERLGKLAFWLMFVGFNVTFFPQHLLGLWGMPRRYYTYPTEYGWDTLNLVSTLGAFVIAAGVLVFVANLVRTAVNGPAAENDPWGADTLEWAASSPPDPFNYRVPPVVVSREPLWEPAPADAGLVPEDVYAALGTPAVAEREQPITTAVDGRFRGVAVLPGPSYWPLVATGAMAILLIGLLLDNDFLAATAAVGAVVSLIGWLRPQHAGGAGATAPTDHRSIRVEGRRSTGVWGGAAGAGVLAIMLAYFLYAYLYLSVSGDEWPRATVADPPLLQPLVLLGVLLVSAGIAVWGGRPRSHDDPHGPVVLALAVVAVTGTAVLLFGTSLVTGLGLAPDEQAYDAIVITVHAVHGAATLAGVLIAGLSAFEAYRLGPQPWVSAAAVVSAVWWCAIVAGWVAVFGVVYVYPQLS